jgi:phenylacetate-CoA ligase
VHPDDLRRLEDLAMSTFTAREDLRVTYPFGLFAVPREKVVRLRASSGTTGEPTVVGYTERAHRLGRRGTGRGRAGSRG